MIPWQKRRRGITRRQPKRFTRIRAISSETKRWARRLYLPLRFRLPYIASTILLVALLRSVTSGSHDRISHINVEGTHLSNTQEIAQTSGLEGTNPFLVNTRAVEQRVAELGVLESATVRIQLPNTATISVVERPPAFIWKVDPTLYLVAGDGTILGPTSKESERVIVVDADHVPVHVGEKIDVSIFQEASYLLSALPKVSTLSPHYLLYSRAYGIMVPTPDGLTIAIGGSSELQQKLLDIEPTLKAAQTASPRPTLIDVSAAHHPYYR